eukprot:5220034-Pleurochrysis_carterae.AAC.2
MRRLACLARPVAGDGRRGGGAAALGRARQAQGHRGAHQAGGRRERACTPDPAKSPASPLSLGQAALRCMRSDTQELVDVGKIEEKREGASFRIKDINMRNLDFQRKAWACRSPCLSLAVGRSPGAWRVSAERPPFDTALAAPKGRLSPPSQKASASPSQERVASPTLALSALYVHPRPRSPPRP